MRQASGISERGPCRPEAWITTGRSGLCDECGQRVEPWQEVLLGTDDEPLIHAEHEDGDGDE